MARHGRIVGGLLVALLVSGFGRVVAQQTSMSDLADAVRELTKKVEQNTQEISGLKHALADKDKELAQKDEEINKLKAATSDLGQKVSKVDSVEKAVQTYVKEAETKTKKEKPLRENEFGVLVGGMSGPYHTNWDAFYGGFIDFAWIPKDPLGNKISGELLAMFGETHRRALVTPYLNSLDPATFSSGWRTQEIDTLALVLGPKYTINWFGPIRPYVATGLGMYVYGQETSNRFVMGQVPVAAGLDPSSPAGNADLQLGANIGGGIEWRINDYLSLGCDARQNLVTGRNTDFVTVGGYLSLNF